MRLLVVEDDPDLNRQLVAALSDAGYRVSLETSGAIDVSQVDERVTRVVDIKTPDSGESARNRMDNLKLLRGDEQVKFVICSRADFDWARDLVRTESLDQRCTVLFSPSHEQVEPREQGMPVAEADEVLVEIGKEPGDR